MENLKNKMITIIQHEVFKYLFFGVLTTVFYIIVRNVLYFIYPNASITSIIANVMSITFAFFTNDCFVFNQKRSGWQKRFVTFFSARLFTLLVDFLLAFLFVDTFPNIIGQFVNQNLKMVNAIETFVAQVFMMVSNYMISKFLVFKDKK
ncbi:GtrA family protein [Streptococcus ovis]|uniref:GtrA family protein n=1 Tax=Streptococcus ovis TaxID=82806 RepID=UPI000475A667|nr:GtrA family protein [Streptococcus ovis]